MSNLELKQFGKSTGLSAIKDFPQRYEWDTKWMKPAALGTIEEFRPEKSDDSEILQEFCCCLLMF